MKSREDTLRVLLDTSFILPTLGIDIGDEFLRGLERLDGLKAEVYYSIFNILESLWVAIRLAKRGVLHVERFGEGLRSIIEGVRYLRVVEGAEVFRGALRLYFLGHRDIIDNILYATSVDLGIKMLTLDEELKEFIKEKGLKNTLIKPDELL
ncbi:MAG: PIN domain-containing protein [Candidatus Bathyarchaeia archaeon]